MIITLSPSPSLDRTYELAELVPGEVNRALAAHLDPAGKGVNVTRALTANGLSSVAVLPHAGHDGAELVNGLARAGVPYVGVAVATPTRSNVTLVATDGATTKVNAPTPALTRDEVEALLAAVATLVREHAGAGPVAIVGAGSMPSGSEDALVLGLAELARDLDVTAALDTSGRALALAAKSGGYAVLKPNDDELAELAGRPMTTVGDVVTASREVIAYGVGQLAVSLGAHGALLVGERDLWWAGGPPLVPLSTVGAGDSTLAGLLARPDDDPTAPYGPEDLRRAVAWGRAAVLLPGTAAPRPDHLRPDDVAVVASPPLSQPLSEL